MKIKILLSLLLGIFVYFGNAKTPKTYSLEIINNELKTILDEGFGTSQDGRIIFIKVKKTNTNEYELKISSDGWVLLRNEYNNDELIGFFKYKNAIGIVYGEKKNTFFKKTGKMEIPDYYLQVVERLKKPKPPIDPDIPPIRYDGSVWYYKYKNNKITFDKSEWVVW
jgi:hypothetical protein